MIELYQFPFSHFCEKARWALDYKGVRYKPVNLLPGFHVKAVKKLAPKSCLPVLVDGETAIQQSAAIITYLDKTHPDPGLTPNDPVQAQQALEWERYFDEEVGVTLRLWYYHHALPDRDVALKAMLDGAPWYARPLFRLSYPKVREAMQRNMNINEATAERSRRRLLAALDKLDDALAGRRFLVGDRFSRADLTACALLSRFCLASDGEAAADAPCAVRAQCDQLRGRRFFRWVRDVYDSYRKPLPSDP